MVGRKDFIRRNNLLSQIEKLRNKEVIEGEDKELLFSIFNKLVDAIIDWKEVSAKQSDRITELEEKLQGLK